MSMQTTLSGGQDSTSVPPKALIESPRFPVAEISEASAIEKGPGRPPHWEMVFWWTRKPLISARAVIAGCLLPESTSPREFLRMIGIGDKKKAAHFNAPLYRFKGMKLLDPFAGFGSIPLEGMRLGLDCTAVELLPTAYVFLKAVLEYPARFGRGLVEDVERWGRWVIERLKEDSLIKELYDLDVAVYIGSWEVKCPSCLRWTPLVGNWWLARVKGKEGYVRLAWMEPYVEDGEVKIRVIDLNRMLGGQAVQKAKVSGQFVEAGGARYRVPDSNIIARRETAACLQCGQPMAQIDPQTARHYTETKSLPKEVKKRLEGYVKHAIKTYNQSLDHAGVTPLAKQRLLVKVKVKNGNLEFEPCTEEDNEKLWKALEKLKQVWGDPDIPTEQTEPYSSSTYHTIVWGIDKFYKLFNTRQLLTHVKLVKLIREAGKKVEEEKLKEGWSREEAFKYAEAVTTYLAIVLVRYIDYDSLCTVWNYGGQLPAQVAHTLSMRGIAMMWNWGDVSPFIKMSGTGTLASNLDKAANKMLRYLISNIRNESNAIESLLDDAIVLNKIKEKKYDLIITDPPYYDDVPYAELSDFYYVWLKRALSDVEGNRLVPRFLPEAFFERVGDGWVEVSTQWEKYALNEVSLNPPRLGADARYEDGVRHFQNLLNSSFITMARKLKDDGLLVTYYAHTDPDAWKALLKAGWQAAGLRVTNAFPLTTESAQSVVKRGKLSMDTSIVVVWRKGASGSIEASSLYEAMVDEAAKRTSSLIELGLIGRDLFISSLASALSAATQYSEVIALGKLSVDELVDKYVYPATCIGIARAYAGRAELRDGIKGSDAMFYLLAKCLIAGAKRKVLESTDVRLLSIGTSLDVKAAIKDWALLKEARGAEEEAGAKVAKARTLFLLEPTSNEKSKVAELLEVKGIGVGDEPNIRCAVDALHVLEYYASAYSANEYMQRLDNLRDKYPLQVNEALALARIFAKVLPDDDPEKQLCQRVISPALQLGGA